MYIVVIGLGELGRHVVGVLERKKHDIVAIDHDPAKIAIVEDQNDVLTVTGYAASLQTLQQAEVHRADLVLTLTGSDEVNLVSALSARELGAKQTIARVKGDGWTESHPTGVQYNLLGVDVVMNPRVLLAEEIGKIARSHGALKVIEFADDRVELAQVMPVKDSAMLNKPLSELALPPEILIGAVVRDGSFFVPHGSDMLSSEDFVFLIGKTHQIEAAEDLFTRSHEARRVCIMGGGVVGGTLARTLLKAKTHVMLIEKKAERARHLSEHFEGMSILHGDGTDMNLLFEEDVGSYDLFVATSHDDEVNLMAALLAKRAGVGRSLCVVRRTSYAPIYRQLGVDIVLSSQLVASEHILRYCKGTKLKSLHLLKGDKGNVLEMVVPEGCKAAGRPLKDLNLSRGILIAAIIDQQQVTIPTGDDIIAPGNTVIVICSAETRGQVAKLFK